MLVGLVGPAVDMHRGGLHEAFWSRPTFRDEGRTPPSYSTRRPEMARLMTRRWISEVPSKIV
jgi:hypothetical protein